MYHLPFEYDYSLSLSSKWVLSIVFFCVYSTSFIPFIFIPLHLLSLNDQSLVSIPYSFIFCLHHLVDHFSIHLILLCTISILILDLSSPSLLNGRNEKGKVPTVPFPALSYSETELIKLNLLPLPLPLIVVSWLCWNILGNVSHRVVEKVILKEFKWKNTREHVLKYL